MSAPASNKQTRQRKNVILALVHVALAVAILTGFVYVQTR